MLTLTRSHSEPAGALPNTPALEPPIFSFAHCDDPDDATERAFAELAAYRAAYRSHRRGAAHGASGEVTRLALSTPALKLAPSLRREWRERKGAVGHDE